LDLASFISIETFAKEFEKTHGKLHLLVCNAGMAFNHYDTTYDGLESQFGTNFVGHYVLVNRLLRTMKQSGGARITVAASIAASMVREIDYSRVTDVWRFDRFANYATSKLALLVFSSALARRLEGTGITVNAFHPGVVATSLYRNVLFTMLPGIDGLLRHWLWLDEKVGSVTSIYLALSSDLEGKSGGYYARELPAIAHPDASDVAVQERLCQFTDILIASNTHSPTLLESINSSAVSDD
ncbi:Retinol dehydrogenase 13, partial [Coemansia sp. RSA 2559]